MVVVAVAWDGMAALHTIQHQAEMVVVAPAEEFKRDLDLLEVLIPVVAVVVDKPMVAPEVPEDQELLLYQYLLVITLAQ
jgi:hypothetical protein